MPPLAAVGSVTTRYSCFNKSKVDPVHVENLPSKVTNGQLKISVLYVSRIGALPFASAGNLRCLFRLRTAKLNPAGQVLPEARRLNAERMRLSNLLVQL